MPRIPKQEQKPNLKVIAGNKPAVVAGGNLPDESMQPGRYVARCQTGKFIERGSKLIAVLVFEIAEGPHTGTALREWIKVNEVNGVVGSGSKYYEHCRLALGRPIKRGDGLEPDVIFAGKLCVVEVGYRLNGADRRFDPANALTKKNSTDFLRVHSILEVKPPPSLVRRGDGDLRPEGAGEGDGDSVVVMMSHDNVMNHNHDYDFARMPGYPRICPHIPYDPGILVCVMQRADDKAETSHHATGGSGSVRSPRLKQLPERG